MIFVLMNLIHEESFYTMLIKKGTPKVFRHCEIVENILRLHVRITMSLRNITKS